MPFLCPSIFALQKKFGQIKGGKGLKFIDICNKLNVVLEFGVQSLIEKECKIIERENDSNNIEKIIKIMNDKRINYEISLIYGLPEQSVKTFKDSIMYLQSMGCKKMKMYPLMLLKGTKLYEEKDRWGLKEEFLEDDIPLVIESNSFSKLEWEDMRFIAEQSANENCLGMKNGT
jgi:radical SAM superfamily enzyme